MFGPLRCAECQSSHPVAEGVVELVLERESPAGLQRGLELRWVARSWERYLRPAVSVAVTRRRFDRDSEYLLLRSLLGTPDAPVLDLGCGTGLFARRLAREPAMPPVVGMDVARAMLEESVAQAREARVRVDFVHAAAPELPFLDGSLGGVLHSDALHLVEDAARLFVEVSRVLRPGGRYVATTYLPPGFPAAFVHRQVGLHPRTEVELRAALTAAGLVRFERMLLPPFIVVKAEKPTA
ncbi:MAG: class I SAM-dependent methyltransferase [Myxococcaceae bacterium]